ncbi:N-acetyltransferase domain-containing protein [Fusarium keratoplasticum]|uniref:N-acetyltransferase domain-containing protein n=1 Tax=Fusarium keratoplasticum TaxID=1328300 RepID=A0ACC0QFV5_9HYPO|nr:N-acetyltransferase domain-containing protein [Fusarium keratoplasticum]KAI8650933.1 N-acetyltransferase domain-containing protein [Fusarium keratoplasticum]
MAISILPVASSDLPMLAEFVHSSKLCLTINRLLYLDWPNDAAQKPQYRRAVESSFNNDMVQCLKAVDEESNELVGYLVLTPKTPVEARKDTEIGSDAEEQSVPEGMHAGVWSAVTNAAAKIHRETASLDHLELTYIYVKPSHRQKGIGSLLLQEAFRRAHADRVPLALCSEPAAYSFYKNRGFQDTKHVDIDLRLWAPPYTGFGIFRLSGMIRRVEGEMSGVALQS